VSHGDSRPDGAAEHWSSAAERWSVAERSSVAER